MRYLDPKRAASTKTGLQLMSTLSAVVMSYADAVSYVAERGIQRILDFCLQLNPVDKDAVLLVEYALKAIKECAATGKVGPENLTSTMKLVDLFDTKKNIVDRGSAAMASIMGPEQLKRCLAILSSASENSEDRSTALAMLTSMSYISSYAEAIVKAGSLPVLCDAVASELHH